MKTEHAEAKQRLFDAAVSLFARKGYAAVGVREIATAAGVNLSTVSYYYGGKAGLHRAIVNEANSRAAKLLAAAGGDSASAEEHVRNVARGLVRFFRENTELALVGLNAFPPPDDPETVALGLKWSNEIAAQMTDLYRKLGLDVSDPVQMGVVMHSLPMTVMTFFESIFAVEQTGAQDRVVMPYQLDDAFFDHYAEHLAELFLYGVTGMTRLSRAPADMSELAGRKPDLRDDFE